jgi:phosphoenolpyruvate synthase/pyruvate phosphate dikinase
MTQTAPPAGRPHRADKRYIYAWGGGHAEGDASMRDLLGGKGAGLAEMTNAGLPVPPGFTITTEACNDYFTAGEQLPAGLWDDVLEAVKRRSSARPARASATLPTRSSSRCVRGPSSRCPG